MSAHQCYFFDVLFMRVVLNRAANRIKLGDFSLVAARVKSTGQTSFAAQWTKSKCKKKIRCQATCRSKKFATEWARIDWVLECGKAKTAWNVVEPTVERVTCLIEVLCLNVVKYFIYSLTTWKEVPIQMSSSMTYLYQKYSKKCLDNIHEIMKHKTQMSSKRDWRQPPVLGKCSTVKSCKSHLPTIFTSCSCTPYDLMLMFIPFPPKKRVPKRCCTWQSVAQTTRVILAPCCASVFWKVHLGPRLALNQAWASWTPLICSYSYVSYHNCNAFTVVNRVILQIANVSQFSWKNLTLSLSWHKTLRNLFCIGIPCKP